MMNFIPIDLRERLRADADTAERNGNRLCAGILWQIADYEGDDAPRRARELGVQAFEVRSPAAAELMQLVRHAEEEREL